MLKFAFNKFFTQKQELFQSPYFKIKNFQTSSEFCNNYLTKPQNLQSQCGSLKCISRNKSKISAAQRVKSFLYGTSSVQTEVQKATSTSTDSSLGERKVLVDGINLNVREDGEGTHNVLCLPGIVGTIGTDFGKIFDTMNKSKFRLISWDPPGYGKSRPPDSHHAPDFYLNDARLVAKLMETLGYKQYSILGWSNGGMTGYTLAAEFPERVSHLVLWGAHAYIDDRVMTIGLRMCNTFFWSKHMLNTMLQVYDKDYLEKTLTRAGAAALENYESGGHHLLRERVASIQCPTFVFHGEKDPILHIDHAHYFATHVKHCQVKLIPEAKHNLHLTHTREFVSDVENFLLSPPKEVSA